MTAELDGKVKLLQKVYNDLISAQADAMMKDETTMRLWSFIDI